MIGGGVTAHKANKNLQIRAYISLKEVRHQEGSLPMTDKNFKFTNFQFYIKYKKSASRSLKYKPFLLSADILNDFGGAMRLKGYQDFLDKAETMPELRWLVNNTIHSEEVFELAEANPNIPIMLPFDAVQYAKKVIQNDTEKVSKKEQLGVYLVKDIAKADKSREELYIESFKKREVK